MSTSIPQPLPTGKDPPDKENKSPNQSLKLSKSPQQASSVPEQPTEAVQRPSFVPFFTLITDPSNSSTHHPTQVHYIFSDDDPEILTSACLTALSPASPSTSTPSPQAVSSSSSSTSGGPNLKTTKPQKHPTSSTKEKASSANPKPSQREERTIILTLSESGDSVVSAHSLTPTWQILSTEITNAPTWDAANTEGTSHAGGLMLRIEGTDGTIPEENLNTIPQSSGAAAGKSSESQRRGDISGDMAGIDMQALMESFDAKMNMLRKVIEAGGSTLSGEVQQGEIPHQEGME